MNASALIDTQRNDWNAAEVDAQQRGEAGTIGVSRTARSCPTVGTDWMDEGPPFANIEW